MAIKIRNRYNERKLKPEFASYSGGESLTDESKFEDCDIKLMAQKYGIQGVLQKTTVDECMYGYDLTEATTIQERLEIKERIKEYFFSMPPHVRKEFNDDYRKFTEMYQMNDTAKMERLGILPSKKQEVVYEYDETKDLLRKNNTTEVIEKEEIK